MQEQQNRGYQALRISAQAGRGKSGPAGPKGLPGRRNREWIIKPVDGRCEKLGKALKVSPLLAQVLINRGIADRSAACAFLSPKLADLISPEQLPGITAAVARITKAIKGKEKITVYGDYDVDGITAVAILWQILTLLGANVDYYIPHRVDEGYGLNEEAIGRLSESGTRLLITVDCGITAFDSAALARKLGMDLIITDHHQQGSELPSATAIVHPATDSSYPNQDSSGSMVAFKLGWAVADQFKSGRKISPDIRDFMINATSLAAMGTIADVMDLRGENRVLASFGLSLLADCKLAGVQALIESAELTGRGLDSFDIGFRLAPMLNAAGRLGHARLAVELLTTNSAVRSAQIAGYLKDQNAQRQRLERKIFKQACEMIVSRNLNHPDSKTIVLASDDWHSGVIGIVASRIVEKFYRPTIMINTGGPVAQGSGRSVERFDILKAITACSKHLVGFGGHKMAAGITLEPENVGQFTDEFEIYAQQHLTCEDCTAKLHIDGLASLAAFNHDSVAELERLGPFGQGNPQPLFATKGVRLCSPPRRVGAGGDHLQIAITDNTGSVRCIGFRFGKLEKKLVESEFFNVAYHPQLNEYNGFCNVQLVLADIQFE